MDQKATRRNSYAVRHLTRRRFIQASSESLVGATLLPPLVVTESRSADSVLPRGKKLNWDETIVVNLKAKRSRVLLDGIWKFMPAIGGETKPPEFGWGLSTCQAVGRPVRTTAALSASLLQVSGRDGGFALAYKLPLPGIGA